MNRTIATAENSIGPSFEVIQGDSLFVPYGIWPHKNGRQRFDRGAGERMQQAIRGTLAGVKRLLTTGARRLPVYIGHPDVPGRGAEFPDKRAMGWVDDIQVENDGVRLEVSWTEEGRRQIEQGHFRFYSPYWEVEYDEGNLLPVELISVGLTNNPNIPVPPLANDGSGDETQTNDDDEMKNKLAELLGKSDDASEQELLDEVKRLRDLESAQENDDADDEAEDADDAAEDAADEAEEEAEAAAEAAAANDVLGRIRQERIAGAVDALIIAGKLTPAERSAASQRLEACANDADYDRELEALRNGDQRLKTVAVTDELAAKGGEVRSENDRAVIAKRRADLMDAEMKANGGKFSLAWNKLARKHPELFR